MVAALVMLPLKFPTPDDKRRALVAAFLNRFGLGFVVANLTLPLPTLLSGALLGLGISSSSAVISRAYAPILIMGTAIGALCAWVAQVAS